MAITTSSRFTRIQLNYTNSIIDLLVQTTDGDSLGWSFDQKGYPDENGSDYEQAAFAKP